MRRGERRRSVIEMYYMKEEINLSKTCIFANSFCVTFSWSYCQQKGGGRDSNGLGKLGFELNSVSSRGQHFSSAPQLLIEKKKSHCSWSMTAYIDRHLTRDGLCHL